MMNGSLYYFFNWKSLTASEKNLFLYFLIGSLTLGMVAIAFSAKPEETLLSDILCYVLLAGTAAFLVLLLVNTKYIIKANYLYCYGGPVRRKIDIGTITKIEADNHIIKPVLLKLSLHHKGFIIYYNASDGVFISPKDQDQFIAFLLELNPAIAVT